MDKKIKILHVTDRLGVGGLEEILLITAKFNLDDKYELGFVTYNKTNKFISDEIMRRNHSVYNLNFSSRIYDLRVIPKLVKICKIFRPQILHLYSKGAILGSIAGKIAKVPIILCSEMDMDWARHGIGLKYAALLKKRSYLLFDKIISCSEAVRQYWDHKQSNKHSVLHLPFDTSKLPDDYMRSTKEGFANKQYPVVGVVTRIFPGKGLEYLIEGWPLILKNFPNARLKIVGTGPQLNDLKYLSKTLNCQASIEFTGFVENLYQALSAMDIFVFPSLSEGFPISIMEAMAMGLPIATTQAGGIKEIVEDGKTGMIFPAKHPARLAETVNKMLANYDQALTMGRRAQKKVVHKFSPQIYIDKLDTLYRQLLVKI